MDEIDRKLIAFARDNGRASYAEMGTAAGLSVSAVNERLRKLADRGVITGWGARIAARRVGLDVLAFIHLLVERPEHEEAFRAGMIAAPEVEECHHVTGEWSYLIKVRVTDTAALERFLSKRLKSLSGVVRTHSVIALSSVKEDGRGVEGETG